MNDVQEYLRKRREGTVNYTNIKTSPHTHTHKHTRTYTNHLRIKGVILIFRESKGLELMTDRGSPVYDKQLIYLFITFSETKIIDDIGGSLSKPRTNVIPGRIPYFSAIFLPSLDLFFSFSLLFYPFPPFSSTPLLFSF